MYNEDIEIANKARFNAYSPYSNFEVGAALRTKSGKIYTGCNIENHGIQGICAERVAITSAVAAGYRKADFKELHVMVDSDKLGMPCFLCRQVIIEFFDEIDKVYVYSRKSMESFLVKDICPYPFTEDNLWKVAW